MRTVLAIGAHPDDLELGCAGTLAAHAAAGDDVHMLVVTSGQSGPGDVTVREHEAAAAAAAIGATLHWGGFEDCKINPDRSTVMFIEELMAALDPHVVYVHHTDDTHQDHRAVAAATLSAARRHSRVLHYQSPSSVGFVPTVFVDISDHLDAKMAALDCHRSQVEMSAMVEPDVVVASARHYGALARVAFAEGFRPTRFVWDLAADGHTEEYDGVDVAHRRQTVSDDGTTGQIITLPDAGTGRKETPTAPAVSRGGLARRIPAGFPSLHVADLHTTLFAATLLAAFAVDRLL